MSIYYLPNPKNQKAMWVVGEHGDAPMKPFVDGATPFFLTVIFGLSSWFLWINDKQGWAIACGLACVLSIMCVIGKFEPLLRRKHKLLRKMLAKGEIVAVPEDVTQAFREHLYAAGMITSQEDRAAMLWSFDALSALTAVLRKVDTIENLSEENLRQRDLLISQRTGLMVRAICNEKDATATGLQVENNLGNHWVAEVLRGEVDG